MDETTARHHMERAIAEMWQSPSTSRIGVVVARGETVLASVHKGQGGNRHAEVIALNAADAAGIDLRGTTAFVTLEPCANLEGTFDYELRPKMTPTEDPLDTRTDVPRST
ncbi:hypothetical protein ACSHWB_38320 [Lentzea sp. HUAS TT2]|uniref:hypothetical protein n=1 Tax=Lentzea sp. HUAS TT2 TaxID=3447454 RepID=UPI003F6F009C